MVDVACRRGYVWKREQSGLALGEEAANNIRMSIVYRRCRQDLSGWTEIRRRSPRQFSGATAIEDLGGMENRRDRDPVPAEYVHDGRSGVVVHPCPDLILKGGAMPLAVLPIPRSRVDSRPVVVQRHYLA